MSHAQQLHNRRSLDGSMPIINRAGLPDKVKAAVCQQVHATVLATVQWTIEQALEEERTAYGGCQRFVPLPQGRPTEYPRSGGDRRVLRTQYAGIPALRVPKLRRGTRHLCWQTITRDKRCWGALRDQQVLSFCLGLSLRDLQEAMRLTRGDVRSLEACHRLV